MKSVSLTKGELLKALSAFPDNAPLNSPGVLKALLALFARKQANG